MPGDPADSDRDHAVDLVKLIEFLRATQPRAAEQLRLEADGPDRQRYAANVFNVTRPTTQRDQATALQQGRADVPPAA